MIYLVFHCHFHFYLLRLYSWHNYWAGKLKIFFAFHSFLIRVVRWGIYCLRIIRSWIVSWPSKATDFWVTSFSFCLAHPELRIGLFLLTKFKASLPAQCSFRCSPWIPRHRCPIFLLSIMLSEESDNKLLNLLIVRDAFPSSSLSIDETIQHENLDCFDCFL